MFESVRLTNFKNFRDATLPLGPFTVIVGTNASGKSNLRDAFRFLHGIGRGYTLAEIIGEKYGDGGERVWRGIRGGVAEIGLHNHRENDSIGVEVDTHFSRNDLMSTYQLQFRRDLASSTPIIVRELFRVGVNQVYLAEYALSLVTRYVLAVAFGDERDKPFENRHALSANTPVLCQLKPVGSPMKAQLLSASEFSDFLASIRFLDLSPDEMKRPSLPGQLMLGDRGENLSSVLMAICADADSKRGLTEWLQELTPVDVIDLDFVEDQQGRVSVTLVEASGTRTSVHSASDGTLRFLGLLAALMGPKRPRVLFLDEIDTGIHPARLHLLVQLIEHHTAKGDLQVIATTHSPQLLALLSERSRNDAVLVYRLHGATDAGIKRIVDIPHAREVLQNESLSRLHETGWLENAVEFAHAEPAS